MLTIRKFLRTLIGTATPMQILLACVLGSLVGFLPITGGGWTAATLLAIALLVLNANLFLGGLVATATKLLSIATAPIAFEIGVVLVDGPLQPVFRRLVNGPVTAWLGFDSYLAVGGLVLGLVVGTGLGVVVATSIQRLRRRLAGLESTSDAFQTAMASRPVRFLAWIVFGGIPKGGFTELDGRTGLPIRTSGVVTSLVLVVGIGIAGWLLADGTARNVLVDRLTRINGATVDLGDLRIDWSGRVEITNLAVCDSDRLDRDVVAAGRLVADLDVSDILRRRVSIDLIEATDVRNDVPRQTPGRRVETDTTSRSEPEDVATDDPSESAKRLPIGNLDEYLRTAAAWRSRLEQIAELLERVRERVPPGERDATGTGEVPDRRAAAEAWLRSQVDLHGYAGVRAVHLLEDHPTVLVRSIVAGGVRRGVDDPRRFDVYLDSISTAPRLVDAPPSVRIRETGDDFAFFAELASLSRTAGDDRFRLDLRNLPTDDISTQLLADDPPAFSGGRLDATLDGRLILGDPVEIAAPIEVTLVDSRIRIGGEEATIPRLALRLDVGGALSDPAIAIDQDALEKSLRDAGHAILAEKARSEAEKHLDDGLQRLEEKVGIELPEDLRNGIGDVLDGGLGDLLGGGRKP